MRDATGEVYERMCKRSEIEQFGFRLNWSNLYTRPSVADSQGVKLARASRLAS